MYHTFIEFIILLYTFLIIYFAWYKEYMIRLISFSKLSDVLTALTWTRAIANIWSICLGVSIFTPFPCVACCFYWKYSTSESIKSLFSTYIGPTVTLSKVFRFLSLPSFVFSVDLLLNFIIFSNRLVLSISASSILIIAV